MLWILQFCRTQWEHVISAFYGGIGQEGSEETGKWPPNRFTHTGGSSCPLGAHLELSSGRVNQPQKVFNGTCEHPQRVITAFQKEGSISSTILVVQAITDQPTGRELDPSLSGVHVFLEREAALGGHLPPTLSTKGTSVAKPWGSDIIP